MTKYRIPKSGPAPHWRPIGCIQDGIQRSQFSHGPLCWELITGRAYDIEEKEGGFESSVKIADLAELDPLARLCNATYSIEVIITNELKEMFGNYLR